jgi:CheY-like chemotaxis protein
MVTPDPMTASTLSQSLSEWGYAVMVSPTTDEAIERLATQSPHGVIYDYAATTRPEPAFADRLRACPGMGLVPILYLTADGAPPGKLPERCAARAPTDSDAVLVAAFNQLRAHVHLGRTFTRYPAVVAAELRHGGRASLATTIDVSRGGVRLACDHVPPVGSPVRVVLYLRGSVVDMPGDVVRVHLPRPGVPDQRARIGVAFRTASPREEEPLITYVTGLARTPELSR